MNDDASMKTSYIRLYDSFFSKQYGSIERVISMRPGLKLAQCWQCGLTSQSDPDLPFFKSMPDGEFDSYYCGDSGWD